MRIELAGQALALLAEHALYWPAQSALVLSDPHFGKGNVFRRQGLAVPRGSTRHDLDRISALIEQHRPDHWWILGDFVHAPPRPDEPWLEAFAQWRQRHRQLAISVVAGNHDRQWLPPADWQIDWRNHPWPINGLVLDHEPHPHPAGPTLAGHLHPVIKLKDGRQTLRLPVFWQHAHGLVLPSFGSFTGGHAIKLGPGEKAWGIVDEQVIAL